MHSTLPPRRRSTTRSAPQASHSCQVRPGPHRVAPRVAACPAAASLRSSVAGRFGLLPRSGAPNGSSLPRSLAPALTRRPPLPHPPWEPCQKQAAHARRSCLSGRRWPASRCPARWCTPVRSGLAASFWKQRPTSAAAAGTQRRGGARPARTPLPAAAARLRRAQPHPCLPPPPSVRNDAAASRRACSDGSGGPPRALLPAVQGRAPLVPLQTAEGPAPSPAPPNFHPLNLRPARGRRFLFVLWCSPRGRRNCGQTPCVPTPTFFVPPHSTGNIRRFVAVLAHLLIFPSSFACNPSPYLPSHPRAPLPITHRASRPIRAGMPLPRLPVQPPMHTHQRTPPSALPATCPRSTYPAPPHLPIHCASQPTAPLNLFAHLPCLCEPL